MKRQAHLTRPVPVTVQIKQRNLAIADETQSPFVGGRLQERFLIKLVWCCNPYRAGCPGELHIYG